MIRAIVTDIEGTTSSLSFVKDVLFPYAREHLPGYVRANAGHPSVRAELDTVKAETGAADDESAIAALVRWIDEDRKATPLKTLQGCIWEAGYKAGHFKGHIYPDAVRNLRRWHASGLDLYVYSSGSVQAQQLLFGYSDAGDLQPLFKGWFDTRIGHKREADSYRAIVRAVGRPGQEILFLSDVVEELDAARAAGLATCCLVRGAIPNGASRHAIATDFDAIEI